jgi:rSAM/selenodomain-associated transferase 1
MRNCLIIFAKEPLPGKVKTRLRGSLSASQCLELYKLFLRDTVALARRARSDARFVAYESQDTAPAYLKTIAPEFTFFRQRGSDLGRRMHNAFVRVQDTRPLKTAIIGSDIPDLPVGYIDDAFEKLNRHDLVLGPSRDGGYYLVALKRPCFGLFEDVMWSTGSVLAQTLKNAGRLKIKSALLSEWYDIDEERDLGYLKSRLNADKDKNIAAWTRKSLKI